MNEDVEKKAICPFCGKEMVRCYIEHDDNSGWMYCWACNCETVEWLEKKHTDELATEKP